MAVLLPQAKNAVKWVVTFCQGWLHLIITNIADKQVIRYLSPIFVMIGKHNPQKGWLQLFDNPLSIAHLPPISGALPSGTAMHQLIA